jgi:16S rRNA (adenine(1408)-N(1))-methyltransferase
VIVVEGKRTRELPRDELDELAGRLSRAGRVHIDVGTGDGRYAYATATAHPDWLVVGIDAIREPLAEISTKAARKPAKGGRDNLLFVRASAEDPPPELHGTAHEVGVVLPWGALLTGAVLAQPAVLQGLTALARPEGADLTVVLNAEPWEESTPKDMAGLPAVTVDYAADTLAPAYAEQGVTVTEARLLDPAEVKALPTTWARRLAASHQGRPRFVLVKGRIAGRG